MNDSASTRLDAAWDCARRNQQKLLIPFIMAGDPNLSWSEQLLTALPQAGADIIELGMPFSDPMADGPVIQQAGLRALKAGVTISDVLGLVAKFRQKNQKTPIILMGYYNPIHHYGVEKFINDALAAGVDGLIIVDVPWEEDAELCQPVLQKKLGFIRMVTPVTDEARAEKILHDAQGFVYAVSIAGITGTKKAGDNAMADLARRIEAATDLPKAIGFGIKNTDDAKMAVKYFDAVVIGSAIVEMIDKQNINDAKTKILQFVQMMKQAIS